MDILKDDGAFVNLICLIVVIGFILVAVVRAFKGKDDL
jgi:hypothetical protein